MAPLLSGGGPPLVRQKNSITHMVEQIEHYVRSHGFESVISTIFKACVIVGKHRGFRFRKTLLAGLVDRWGFVRISLICRERCQRLERLLIDRHARHSTRIVVTSGLR